ncbi:uncharacterized protein [Montipora capricornis]|uniref:uncharacterized protein isoform X1 n=1 Tax=Montipora capricornis TaxID=246305 RepID=UPI0035F19311
MTKASIVGVCLFVLVSLAFTPFGLLKEKKWKKYRPYWCTPQGRTFVRRGTTARQCQGYCSDRCEAVEWWRKGKQACYICKNVTLITKYPYKSDMSFPPIVFVKKPNGAALFNISPVAKHTVRTSTTSLDERITTISSNEVTTATIAMILSTVTVAGPFTRAQEETPLSTTDKVGKNTSSQNNNLTFTGKEEPHATSSPLKEGRATSPEDKGTPSGVNKEGTTPSHEATKYSLHWQRKTSSLQQQTTLSPEDDGTATSVPVIATSSSEKQRLTSLPNGKLSSKPRTPKKDKKWKKYKPYWCTPPGRTLVKRGTTARECRSYCGEGCEAIEWWRKGKQACYICKNVALITKYPYKSDMSYPPIVFVKNLSGLAAIPTTLPITSGIPSTSDEGIATTFLLESKTTAPLNEGTTVFSVPETASHTNAVVTPSTPAIVSHSGTVSSSPSTSYGGIPTIYPLETKTTAPLNEGTIAYSVPERTSETHADVRPSTSTIVSLSGTVSSNPSTSGGEIPTTSPLETKTTAPLNEGTTVFPVTEIASEEELKPLSPEGKIIASPPDEEAATSLPDNGKITFSPEEEETTSSEEEGIITLPDEKSTPSPVDGEGTTPSVYKETNTLPLQGEQAISLQDKEREPLTDEGDTSSLSLTGRTMSSVHKTGTVLPEEMSEVTTSSEDEGATTQVVLPNSPRSVAAKSLSGTELEVTWEPPSENGIPILFYKVEVKAADLTDLAPSDGLDGDRSFRVPGTKRSLIVDSLSPDTQYRIVVLAENPYGQGPQAEGVYTRTSKSFRARIESSKPEEERLTSCVSVDVDVNVYVLNASHGVWPHSGLCPVFIASNASKHDNYRVSADLFVPKTRGLNNNVYFGILFNAAAENHFDFVVFRFGDSDGTCFQTGVMREGQMDWFGSQSGSCPYGAPYKERWIHTMLEVRDSEVTVFLNDVYLTSYQGHIPQKASVGVVLANNEGNVARFKDLTVTDQPSLPFYMKSCASLQHHSEYYTLINQNDVWSRGFCRVLLKDTPVKNGPSYQISVDFYSEMDWSGDRISYVGILFNARDINNADFIYFRPLWKDHCYQTGYLLGSREMREASTRGHCSRVIKSGKWFNVRLEIRGYKVYVMLNNKHTTTFKSHYQSSADLTPGIGLLVTGGCQKSMRFKNFVVSSLPELPFVYKNCQGARVTANVFKLMSHNSNEHDEYQGICRALFPEVPVGKNYVLSVNIHGLGSIMGEKYGVIFNAKSADSFEFVCIRPYNRDNCIQVGCLQDNEVKIYSKPKILSCGYGSLRGGSWHNIRVKVAGSEVKVLIDDLTVAVFMSHFDQSGRGGVILGSGVERKLSFTDYAIIT